MARQYSIGRTQKGELRHYIVATIIKNREGKYLLIERKNILRPFGCITSHIYGSETHLEAFEREVYEETGFRPKKSKLIEEKEFVDDECIKGVSVHYWYLFECECNGTPRLNEYNASAISWYSQEQLQELADMGKLMPVWESWFRLFNIVSVMAGVQEMKKESADDITSVLSADKLKGLCREDLSSERCSFLALTDCGWACERNTDLGDAIREHFAKESKGLQDNCKS